MLLGEAQPLEHLLVGHALRFVAQIRARVECGAELRERPAFDEAHFGLRDVAPRELVEKLGWRQRLGDLVASRLDVAHLAQGAREDLELVRTHADPGFLELLERGAKARAARNLDFHGVLADRDRRAEVPRAIARDGDAHENNETEKGLQQFRGGKIAFYDGVRAAKPVRIARCHGRGRT